MAVIYRSEWHDHQRSQRSVAGCRWDASKSASSVELRSPIDAVSLSGWQPPDYHALL